MSRAVAADACLANAALTMAEAGAFTWALGRLLRQVAEHDTASDILDNDAMIAGLAMGLQMIGATLQDDAEEYRQLIENATESAPRNEQSQIVARDASEVPQ